MPLSRNYLLPVLTCAAVLLVTCQAFQFFGSTKMRSFPVARRALHAGGLFQPNSRALGRSMLAFQRFLRPKEVATMSATAGGEIGNPVSLEKLRVEMGRLGVDAFLVPTDDPHLSEYTPTCYNRREFLSGFTGSAGTALVLKDEALLWTDGRYYLQAEQQLGPGWRLMRAGQKGVPSLESFLLDKFQGANATVGLDPQVHSAEAAAALGAKLAAQGHALRPLAPGEAHPVDAAWGPGRPPSPPGPARPHPLAHAGRAAADKVADVQKELKEAGADAAVFGMLDEVAWLYNLRGADIAFCPVVLAYALVPAEGPARLYIDAAKVTEAVAAHLAENQVEVRPYGDLLGDVGALGAAGRKLMLDKARVNYAIFRAVPEGQVVAKTSPLQLPKARKNEAEIAGMRAAHARDGAAECEFLCWLEEEVSAKKRAVSEVEIDAQLTARRAARQGFLDLSFPTIAGAGPNGAIIHYRAEPGTCRNLDDQQVLLLDSGAQYEDGTTDVTRTMHLGQPTARERDMYTRVLKGNIGVDRQVFPEDTPGFMLDSFARQALWAAGVDYAHGTGHGVGAALNVHEGPHSISPRYANKVTLQPGMVVSNEPGYYESGSFGIRIENLLLVKETDMKYDVTGKKFLCFEKLTKIPIQKKMIDFDLMTDEEIKWLNDYHKDVWHTISPLVEGKTLEWLRAATAPVEFKH